jgi:hypothetical protein
VSLSAGIALAAIETGTTVVVGGLGAVVLTLPALLRWAGHAAPDAVVPLTASPEAALEP